MSDDLKARLREIAEEAHHQANFHWTTKDEFTGGIHDALLAAVRLGMEQGIEAACKAMDDCVKVSQMHPWTAADMKAIIRAAMPKGSEP